MKLIKHKSAVIVILLSLLGLFVYHRWISLSIFAYGDLYMQFKEEASDFLALSFWHPNYGFGQIDLGSWALPIKIIYGILGRLGLDTNIANKLVFLWPFIFLTPITGFLLTKKVLKNNLAAIVGSFVFSYNTYFLAIATHGHLTLMMAPIFAVLAILFFIKTLDNVSPPKIIYTSLLLFITGFYDFRVLYMTIFIFLFYFIYFLITQKCFQLKSAIKIFFIFLSVLIFFGILNVYWIFPSVMTHSFSENSVLSRDLVFDNYLNISRSITLFHPFWNGSQPDWFNPQTIPFYFWLIPIIAFSGLYLKRKNKLVVFFGFIALIGILLSKQIDLPFENLYLGLRQYLPGFGAFREATKFYFLIILGYSVLIGAFVSWIDEKWRKNRQEAYFKYLLIFFVSLLFLWNTKPLITGTIGSTFIPRHIPKDYLVFKDFINRQPEFFRTFWLPTYSKWSFYNYNHPMISATELERAGTNSLLRGYVDGRETDSFKTNVVGILNKYTSNNFINTASIKYVIIPIEDSTNDDNLFADYGNRDFYIQELAKISYLKKIDIGTQNLIIYENENFRPHIYLTKTLESIHKYSSFYSIDFSEQNPSKYTIRLTNISGLVFLNFSESYHPDWKLKLGNGNWISDIFSKNQLQPNTNHIMNDSRFNSFYINPKDIIQNHLGTYTKNKNGGIDFVLTLYFAPQNYFYLGLIFSSAILFACVVYLVWVYFKKKE